MVSPAERLREQALGKKQRWGSKDWTTSKVRARFQAIFQRKAWTLEGTKGNQIVSWGKESGEAGAELADKKEETETEANGRGNPLAKNPSWREIIGYLE